MITSKKLLDAVSQDAASLLDTVEFRVANHSEWARYDESQQGLVDASGAPVIARFDDIIAYRVNGGPVIQINRPDLRATSVDSREHVTA